MAGKWSGSKGSAARILETTTIHVEFPKGKHRLHLKSDVRLLALAESLTQGLHPRDCDCLSSATEPSGCHSPTTTSILASLENSPHSNTCSLPVTHQQSKSQSNLDCKLPGNRNHTRSSDGLSFEFPQLFFYTTQIAFLSFPSLETVRAYLTSGLETVSS